MPQLMLKATKFKMEGWNGIVNAEGSSIYKGVVKWHF